jgi:hypothetical protein
VCWVPTRDVMKRACRPPNDRAISFGGHPEAITPGIGELRETTLRRSR